MFEFIRKKIRPVLKKIREHREESSFRKALSEQKNLPLKIVIGSSGIYQKNWIPSEAHFLNLLEESTWKKYFDINQISNMLAEHVWEHLTLEEGKIAAAMCFKYMKKGGRLRVAVPDGFHKDPQYIDYVKPGGYGAGADDHKVLYNFKTFSSIFEECGFKTELLEYFDEKNNFHAKNWNIDDGFVHRSIKHDERNISGEPVYTSLIIDAIKP